MANPRVMLKIKQPVSASRSTYIRGEHSSSSEEDEPPRRDSRNKVTLGVRTEEGEEHEGENQYEDEGGNNNGNSSSDEDENVNLGVQPQARMIKPGPGYKRRRPSALTLKKKRIRRAGTDPLVHHGRHFGRAVHAMCNIFILLTNGIERLLESDVEAASPQHMTAELKREEKTFDLLMQTVPGLQKRLMSGLSEEQLRLIAELLQKGVSSARSDDNKSLKAAVIDWIAPLGVPLNPPLTRNVKSDRGFRHEVTGALLCPATLDWNDTEVKSKLRSDEFTITGDQWPIFIYRDYKYDPEDPWEGLFQSKILITAYKHTFTSPSSVGKEPRATRSGNARIHGMEKVTVPSLAYVATLLRFSMTSTSVFSSTDRVTDSQRFYTSIVEFLDDPDEQKEVNRLLKFWNQQIFPEFTRSKRFVTQDSVLARLKERRNILKARN